MDVKVFKLFELGLVKGLPAEVIDKVFELQKNPVLGRYDFENKIYINVETYETFSYDEKEFEAHRKYVDVQILLKGKESIYVSDVDDPGLEITKPYVPDIVFMEGGVITSAVPLDEGEFCVLTPKHAHKPCIRRKTTEKVIKAVIKLPVELYNN